MIVEFTNPSFPLRALTLQSFWDCFIERYFARNSESQVLEGINNFVPHIITLHLLIVAKNHCIATITKLRSFELLIKAPLLHILYYINGLTHDFWTRTGGWKFQRSHGAGTSSPSH